MVRTLTAAALVMGLCVLAEPMTARAQEPSKQAGGASSRSGGFVGLDLFGGGAQYQLKNPPRADDGTVKDAYGKFGWDLGGTVSIGVRWLGITGTVGRHTIETVPTYHLVAGPRFTTPWVAGDTFLIRAFAHALAGVARTAHEAPSANGSEIVLGGGFDMFFLRCQFDYVHLNLDPLPKNNFRFFIGGVVPLCLRGCNATPISRAAAV